jgi:hypothetical protein
VSGWSRPLAVRYVPNETPHSRPPVEKLGGMYDVLIRRRLKFKKKLLPSGGISLGFFSSNIFAKKLFYY